MRKVYIARISLAIVVAPCLIVIGWFVYQFGSAIIGVTLSMREIRKSEAHMQQPAVYEPIARDLAAYAAAADEITYPDSYDTSWAPASVRALGPSYVTIDRDSATIGTGGGFHHWGYDLTRVQASSTPTHDAWELEFYSETDGRRPLWSFTSPASAKITKARFLAEAIAGYDERIALHFADGQDEVATKVKFLLSYDAVTEARSALASAGSTLRDDWWVQLVNAVVRARRGEANAGDELQRWCSAKPSFSRGLVLSSFYLLVDDTVAAAKAAEHASAYPPDDPPGMNYNAADRGYSVAWQLAQARQFEAALGICKAMNSYTPNPYAAEFAQLRRHAADRSTMNLPWPGITTDPWPDIDSGLLDALSK